MMSSNIMQSENRLLLFKIITCLIPLLFCFFVYFTNNIAYGGIFETGKYSSIALYWLGEYSSDQINPTRLPGYPALIYLVFKFFGSNNLVALLFVQSFLGCITFYFIIKTLEELKLDNSIIALATLALNFAIIFRFSVFLPNFFFIFILTLSVFFFTKFYLNQKISYFIYFCLFFSSLYLIRPIIHYAIFLTYPLIIFYIIKLRKKFNYKFFCITSLLLLYVLSIGTQFLRSYSYDRSMIYTSQSGQHLFWVVACLSKKYACGSKNMKVYKELKKREEVEIDKLKNINLEKINNIRLDIAKNYIVYELDKEKAFFAAIVSYMKLIFHSTFIEMFGAFKVNASPLYISGENDFFMKLNHIISNSFTNKYSALYVIAILLIIILRFIQLVGFTIIVQSSNMRMYGLIISSIIIIILATGIGLGNPRYRSEAEPLLMILGAIGINGILDKIRR